jgi:hypothetical protein
MPPAINADAGRIFPPLNDPQLAVGYSIIKGYFFQLIFPPQAVGYQRYSADRNIISNM